MHATGEMPPERKNVLLITLDTTRADFVSCLGGDPRNTPNIDALAARSTLFRNATSETNVTNPSHVTIMSGLRAIEHGVHNNLFTFPEDLDMLPRAMRRAGFRTAGFPAAGHIGPSIGWRGFQEMPAPNAGSTMKAAANTDRALDWLRTKRAKRFFLWVHYFDPHTLYTPPKAIAREFYDGDPEAGAGEPIAAHPFFERVSHTVEWLGETRDPEYVRAMYAASLHYADREIGRLLSEMHGMALEHETVVVLTADHGESLGEHDVFYDHRGLYEPSVRIPLIIHVPGLPPTISDEPVSTLDIAPTVVELMGLEMRHAMSGISLVPVLEGRASPALPERATFVHQHAGNQSVSVRSGPWKLIWPIDSERGVLPAVPELFHLDDDPRELENLAERHPDRVRELRALIEPWIELGAVPEGETTDMTEEQLEQLRALGYTDG
jgi:arylsulfatase A-like enzyme